MTCDADCPDRVAIAPTSIFDESWLGRPISVVSFLSRPLMAIAALSILFMPTTLAQLFAGAWLGNLVLAFMLGGIVGLAHSRTCTGCSARECVVGRMRR